MSYINIRMFLPAIESTVRFKWQTEVQGSFCGRIGQTPHHPCPGDPALHPATPTCRYKRFYHSGTFISTLSCFACSCSAVLALAVVCSPRLLTLLEHPPGIVPGGGVGLARIEDRVVLLEGLVQEYLASTSFQRSLEEYSVTPVNSEMRAAPAGALNLGANERWSSQ